MALFPTQINNALTAELAAAKLKIEQLEQKNLERCNGSRIENFTTCPSERQHQVKVGGTESKL